MGVLPLWDSLEAKYSRDLADDDIVELYTQTIVQDKGVITCPTGARHWLIRLCYKREQEQRR